MAQIGHPLSFQDLKCLESTNHLAGLLGADPSAIGGKNTLKLLRKLGRKGSKLENKALKKMRKKGILLPGRSLRPTDQLITLDDVQKHGLYLHPWLEGRTAIITGGAGNIGSAAVNRLADAGTRVVIADLPGKEKSESVLSLIAKHGPDKIAFVPVDLTAPGSIRECIEQTKIRFGRIDSIVCNAADFHFEPFDRWTPADLERLDLHFKIGIMGHVRMIMDAAELCPESKSGSVVTIGSTAGVFAEPNAVAYSIVKAGIEMLARAISMERRNAEGWAAVVKPGHTWGDNHKVRADALGLNRDEYNGRPECGTQNTMIGDFMEPDVMGLAIVIAASPFGKFCPELHVDGGIQFGGFNRKYDTNPNQKKKEKK